MKSIGLDIGDVWTGIAISDALGMLARPLTTVKTENLIPFLTELLAKEAITTIVIGYPITMRGTESEQTKKVISYTDHLKKQFSSVSFAFQDERLTSKQAAKIKHPKTKEEKIESHARAAAFILTNYLTFRTR